jgi:predicted metalloprotease with PDZ domain
MVLAALPGTAASPGDAVSYGLRFDRPNTHLLDITIRADGLRGPVIELAMPAWSPGWYVINNYAKLVQGFSATGPDGQPLPWHKSDKQTWRIELGSTTSVTVRYNLFGDTLAVDWTQYNDRHAHIAGPATWMYLVGEKHRPARLKIEVPAGWRVATGMERASDSTFSAPDYDTFIDSPIEISDFAEKTFTLAGTTYHVIVHDTMGGKDFSKFVEDLSKSVGALVPMFASVVGGPRQAPFADYWFLFHVWPNTSGGLEHVNSTQIFFRSDWDTAGNPRGPLTEYEGKLLGSSHEFFHAWNVKRIRPRPLGPFDYSREAYTPSLWISEGLTDYYGALALVRAGLIKPEVYLELLGQVITRFEQLPGRKERSLEETSWDTWFWYTGPGEARTNIANVTYSYYTGGQVVGHLLDFAIREATDNQKSLDDWMRLLYQRYALPRPGFEPEDAVRAASEVAGKDLSDFFHRYIRGKEPLPYETYFANAGIRVEKKLEPNRGWLGVSYRRADDGRARFDNVIPGSPAEQAGLDRGDFVLAVDDRLVDSDQFEAAIAQCHPGEMMRLELSHRGALKRIAVTLAAYPYPTYTLGAVENPTERQKAIYRAWLGLPK